jgi:signal transduction histidine kinase
MWPLNKIRLWLQNYKLTPARRSLSVVFGFAGLLLLMSALVVDSGFQRRHMAVDSAAVHKDYKQRDALLAELRTNIYRANTLLRDYLLELDEPAAAQQRAELQSFRRRNAAIVLEYQHMVFPNEQASVAELSRNNDAYWEFVAPTLGWIASQRHSQGQTYLRETVSPHRKDLIKLVNAVNRINQRDADAEEERMQALQSQSQQRVTAISSFSLALAVALALSVILHVRNLERDVNRRFAELQEARLNLRRLSDRLVTAHEEERRNLSRELHDELGQSMSAMLMELGRLESKLSKDETSRPIFASVRELAEASVAKVRDLSLTLRPAMLDEIGLVPALRWQAREVTRRSGMKVSIIADDAEDDLPDTYRTCIYRVVQEALHNCVKHSRATQVRVVMKHQNTGLAISIEDTGVGFDPKHEKGLGLLGIAERVGQLGGQFHIESKPGHGAVASVYLPIPSFIPAPVEETVA